MAKYVVYLQAAEEGGYVVSCPSLPGCAAQGETIEEALAMIRDAIDLYIETLRANGEPVPPGLTEDIERVEVVAVGAGCQS